MKLYRALVVVAVPFMVASCAQPLQKIAAEHREQRMNDIYGNKPVTYGAADGIGASSVEAAHPVALGDVAAKRN